jgi:hypothetical protein
LIEPPGFGRAGRPIAMQLRTPIQDGAPIHHQIVEQVGSRAVLGEVSVLIPRGSGLGLVGES